eukprot:3501363-Amphidinium_carterae.1
MTSISKSWDKAGFCKSRERPHRLVTQCRGVTAEQSTNTTEMQRTTTSKAVSGTTRLSEKTLPTTNTIQNKRKH